MVEAVGSNGGKVSDVALPPVTRVASSTSVRAVASEAPASPAATASTARALAAEPPIDVERVRRIKAAVESGAFPISPATIADRLIALKYQWMSNDEA
jgi:negative regulator of flagellin synthesis FlgM